MAVSQESWKEGRLADRGLFYEWQDIKHDLVALQQRAFTEFQYQTRKSWKRPRRVIAKAEQLPGRANPRFIVTNLEDRFLTPQYLYNEVLGITLLAFAAADI